ncbi:MAG TPA: EF-hand domain-containing protein [Anaeromyxobacter sp.]|nr:EF-hand domain-containing protein [Anaeromyxobacter sp.]
MLAARIARAALAIAVLASFGLAPLARASDVTDEKMPASYEAMMKMKPMDVMQMMDPGKKGYVTKDDFMKFHEALFDKMDKNKDGQVSRQEFSRH